MWSLETTVQINQEAARHDNDARLAYDHAGIRTLGNTARNHCSNVPHDHFQGNLDELPPD